MDRLRILFDPDFDLGAWPGPRGQADSVAGAAWLGPEGFLSTLETHLGLDAPHASTADRVAELVPRLFREDHFFGASAKADPWSTGQLLLAWRDHLWEHGWRGESLGQPRLGQLAEVTLGLPAGRAERLEEAAGWLDGRAIGIAEVRLLVERATLSSAWQRVLSALESGGTRVTTEALTDVHTTGNLLALRGQDTAGITADPTLQLLRCHGPRQAARMIASGLAADPGLGETLFIGADGILDEALAEFGLPTLGAKSAHAVSALAEVLPMTLELAWAPVDPRLALDWLTLPDLPLPREIATRLAGTLAQWPAVGNPAWSAVVDSARAEAPEGFDPVGATVDKVFRPVDDRVRGIRARDLIPRLALLERWAALRAVTSPQHEQIVRQAQALRGRFKLAEVNRLTPPRLDAVLASIVGDGAAARRPALAGYSGVGLPGGVAGPARRVIWWGFVDKGSPRHARVALRASEHRALASIGVELPALGDEVRATAARARRPLYQAEQSLILVSPHHDESGERAHPHPLWDEIVSKLRDPRDARHLTVQTLRWTNPALSKSVPVLLPSTPKHALRASLSLMSRPVESPTSLVKLLGCSFAYAVEHFGRVRGSSRPQLATECLLFGRIAHEVLGCLALEGGLEGDDARRLALEILDRKLPTHGARLLLPGHEHELVLLRDAIGESAALLARTMAAEQLHVLSAEQELRAEFGARGLLGTPDLVLEDPAGKIVLLDFKWAGQSSRRDELRFGTALQLAAYAALLGREGIEVKTLGYLVLAEQRLLVRGAKLSFAQQLHPQLLDETWTAVERAWEARVSELRRGDLYAEGVETPAHSPVEKAALVQGRLVIPAPCTYCNLDLLCERSGVGS